jgi:hypothetical protein
MSDDANQQNQVSSIEPAPRIPLYLRRLIHQPTLLKKVQPPQEYQTRYQALQKLSTPSATRLGNKISVDDVIFG